MSPREMGWARARMRSSPLIATLTNCNSQHFCRITTRQLQYITHLQIASCRPQLSQKRTSNRCFNLWWSLTIARNKERSELVIP